MVWDVWMWKIDGVWVWHQSFFEWQYLVGFTWFTGIWFLKTIIENMIWVCLKIGYTDTHDIAIYIDGEKNWSAIGSTRCWATVDLLSRFFPIDWPDMIEMGNLSAPEDVWWLFWDSDSKFHWICLYWKWRTDLQLFFFFFPSLCWLLSEVRGQCEKAIRPIPLSQAWNPDGITRWFFSLFEWRKNRRIQNHRSK